MEKGHKDNKITENYMILKSYYEKYLEMINDKMVENIEQNIILNYNLKEVNELNDNNQIQIETHLNQKENTENNIITLEDKVKEMLRIEEEVKNIKKIVTDNERIKENILQSIDVIFQFR
jgi:negative regulator of sigma E activity